MDVDVVVVTYRSADHLTRCLEALPRVSSVTVVDNASGDDSIAIARRHDARIVENAANRGFAAAANQGAAASSGRYILFLNPDAVPAPGCVEALVETLDREAELGLVGPVLEFPDGRPQRAAWPFPTARRSWREAVGRRADASEFVTGACLLVRRALFEALSGFDEDFWLYGEEADLARRARLTGWTSRVVQEARCEHVGGASGQESDRTFEEFQRGTERFILKHEGRTALLSHRAALLLGSVLRLAIVAVTGRNEQVVDTRAKIARRLLRTISARPFTVPSSRIAASRTVVVLSLERWDEVWRRNQFLVRELLAADPTCSVVFVEPPHDPLHAFLTRRVHERVEPVEQGPIDRLLIVRPVKLLPRAAGPAADWLLRFSLDGLVGLTDPERTVLWVNDPAWAALVGLGWPVLYDVTDDWTMADRPERVRRRLRKWDDHLTKNADVVVVCSHTLLDGHGAATDLRLIPNGVDVDHFRRPHPRPNDLPGGPCAVYVGTLHEDRLDVLLVAELAAALPDVSLVLVGPVALGERSMRTLRSHFNVHILGSRPYANVPAYLQAADVVVVPHVVTPFTDSLDPIKAYECAAVGRPTVATPVAGFRERADLFTIAARDEFTTATVRALHAGSVGAPDSSDLPTWTTRAAAFAAALADAERSVPGAT